MKEKDIQTLFGKYIKKNPPETSTSWELKLAKAKHGSKGPMSLPFSAFAPHQITALLKAKHKGKFYKIPDDSQGQKPFDCFYIKGPAYAVITYYTPRQPKHTFWIDVDVFVDEAHKSLRRSLTEQRAAQLAHHHHIL